MSAGGVQTPLRFIFQTLLVLGIFFVDVRVKAKTVEVAKDCLQKNMPDCIVHVQDGVESVAALKGEVKASPGATIVKMSDHQFKLVRGHFYVNAGDEIVLESLYGTLHVSGGAAIVEVSDARVRFSNLSAKLAYTPRGEVRSYDLPKGFSNFLSQITSSGVAMAGYPHPAEVENLIQIWSRFYTRLQMKSFMADLEQFQMAWQQAAAITGPWYVDVVEREIAMQKAEEERQARLKAEREKENMYYRNMLLKRMFEP